MTDTTHVGLEKLGANAIPVAVGGVPSSPLDPVIERMDHIVAESLAKGSRLGYFASLYRRVTHQVKKGVADGTFLNGPQMERLAVTFADRYFAAYDAYTAGNGELTQPWQVAFQAAERGHPIILQHLLLGMNAHINLDLAVASAQTTPGIDILSLKHDFMQINAILASQIPVVMKLIGKASPLIGLISLFYRDLEAKVTHFSLDVARTYSWLLAEDLAVASPEVYKTTFDKTATDVSDLGRHLIKTKWLVRMLLFTIGMFESNDVRGNIELLADD